VPSGKRKRPRPAARRSPYRTIRPGPGRGPGPPSRPAPRAITSNEPSIRPANGPHHAVSLKDRSINMTIDSSALNQFIGNAALANGPSTDRGNVSSESGARWYEAMALPGGPALDGEATHITKL